MPIVVCTTSKANSIDRPRQPSQSPLYQLVQRFFAKFQRIYDQRYRQRNGRWHPIIGEVIRKFLTCGDLHFGFARVRCPECPISISEHTVSPLNRDGMVNGLDIDWKGVL